VAGHGMLDLLSFKCRVNGQLMITDQVDSYNAVTFTGRGTDLYTRSAASKSTLFVDGLGCAKDVECEVTEVVKGDGLLGIRIDGSGIFMPYWRRHMFIGRLFLMVENRYWLVGIALAAYRRCGQVEFLFALRLFLVNLTLPGRRIAALSAAN